MNDNKLLIEGSHLVLVDDEPGVLRALSLLLASLKCNVTACSSPHEVVELLDQGVTPDVVVSDLRMPGMSGIELLLALRFKGYSAPFILMSGHATPSEVEVARKADLTAFLSKPFLPHQLVDALQRATLPYSKVVN